MMPNPTLWHHMAVPTYLLIALGNFSSAVDAAVQAVIAPEDRHQIEAGKWLLSTTSVTSKDVSDKIGLSDTTTFLICPIRGYFGRSSPAVWEWLAAKTKTNA
jgi:hypothetical protein